MTGCVMRYCEVSTTCPGSTTSWKLIVKWLQACCIPVAMLPSGLLLLRRPSQGDVRGWLKAPSPKRLINAGVLSLPAILLPVLSVRSIRWMILWAAAPMYCPYWRLAVSRNPQPFRRTGSRTRSFAMSNQVAVFMPTHCWNMVSIPSSIPLAKRSVRSGRTCRIQ